MKRIALFLILLIAFSGYSQSDYQFDYHLLYTNGDGQEVNYYINSKDNSYILSDFDLQQLINSEYTINYNVSLKGETRIVSIVPDEIKNPIKTEIIETGKTEIIENGFKCKKYIYKTHLIDEDGTTRPLTQELYVMNDPLNTLEYFNRNEILFSSNQKVDRLPQGTVVMFKNIGDDYYEDYSLLILKKVTKLEKPIKMDISNQQITKFLLNNQK